MVMEDTRKEYLLNSHGKMLSIQMFTKPPLLFQVLLLGLNIQSVFSFIYVGLILILHFYR